jgi:murein DD-endopeptidase MepM/ murein hydrolase activator NlpD
MRVFSIILLAYFLSETTADGQQKPVLVTATDYSGTATILTAQNLGFCPYTILLTCDLTHMNSSVALPFRKVVVPSKKKVVLARLTPEPGQAYKYTFNYHYYLGNTTAPASTTPYVYSLPFEDGKTYKVIQGSNGTFSHTNKQAIDFQMPENTVVCAAREGVVAEIRQDSNTGCADRSCKDQGNYIIVFHEDGSYATYVHFRQNGSLVQLGQQVSKGEPIGYSGNTGWSSGPHLHFEVDVPGEPEKVSIPVQFSVGGQTLDALQQGMSYKK